MWREREKKNVRENERERMPWPRIIFNELAPKSHWDKHWKPNTENL